MKITNGKSISGGAHVPASASSPPLLTDRLPLASRIVRGWETLTPSNNITDCVVHGMLRFVRLFVRLLLVLLFLARRNSLTTKSGAAQRSLQIFAENLKIFIKIFF